MIELSQVRGGHLFACMTCGTYIQNRANRAVQVCPGEALTRGLKHGAKRLSVALSPKFHPRIPDELREVALARVSPVQDGQWQPMQM
eukprot:6033354-Amphidinium_carterae.3